MTSSQIDAKIDKLAGTSSDSYPQSDKTANKNLALDSALDVIFEAGGRWEFDDANHEDYPIITTALLQGQRDYLFTEDENQNLVLDVYKVFVKDQNGTYQEVHPYDPRSMDGKRSFDDGLEQQNIPMSYDKLGNGIRFDYLPSYSAAAGVKMLINREASYFDDDDTTKKPGFAGLFHIYVAVFAAHEYAEENDLVRESKLLTRQTGLEDRIRAYYGRRERDVKSALRARITRFK